MPTERFARIAVIANILGFYLGDSRMAREKNLIFANFMKLCRRFESENQMPRAERINIHISSLQKIFFSQYGLVSCVHYYL